MQTVSNIQKPAEVSYSSALELRDYQNCLFVADEEHLYSELKSEGVILSLTNGKYYGVNEVGASIWKAVQSPTKISDIQAAVMREYDVEGGQCVQEILTFLDKMYRENLIKIFNEEIG